MTERERLIRAVADEPGDDAPRLVLADWLEEHGEEERGTFIRTGVELARMDEADEHYPETLARYRRSAALAVKPKEPWFDRVPGGKAWFHRGMLVGASLEQGPYLKTKPKDWERSTVEELALSDATEADTSRMSRLRLLRLSGWRRPWVLELLGSSALAGLRELVIDGLWGYEAVDGEIPEWDEVAEAINLPSLESLAWHKGELLAWPTVVPAFGNLSRLLLTSALHAEPEGADSYGWLAGTEQWKGLRQANVWHDINSIGDSTIYQTDPLPDFAKSFKAAPLEDFRLAVEDIPRLAALKSWGALHTLRIGHCDLTDDLAPLAGCPRAKQLRRLLLDHPDGPEPMLGEARPGVLATKHLANLRHLRCDAYYFAEDDMGGLRESPFRENLHRLELGSYSLRLSGEQMRSLLMRSWPELRHLRLGLGDKDAFAALLATKNLPNLCTLTLHGYEGQGEAAMRDLARVAGMPHLSLVIDDGEEWILRDGEARQVQSDVMLRERDAFEQGE